MDLKNWIVGFLKMKDFSSNDILEFKENSDNELVVKRKSKDQIVLILPDLILEKINEKINEDVAIVTLNKASNIDFVVKNWSLLIKNKELTIFFLNLNSSLDIKWAINPYTHDIVCDTATLKQGLLAIAENVEMVS